MAALLTAPHFARNVSRFGAPVGPSRLEAHKMLVSPAALVSNVVRNVAINGERYVKTAPPATETDPAPTKDSE